MKSRTHRWSQRRNPPEAQQLRVLVVDDNQNAAEAFAMYLSFEQMESRVAFGGAEAISVATDWVPHVIIMDISMPGCSGFDAALVLRHSQRTHQIAIIAFTALDEAEVRRHIVDSEFDGYCQKGEPPARLVTLISELTGQVRLS